MNPEQHDPPEHEDSPTIEQGIAQQPGSKQHIVQPTTRHEMLTLDRLRTERGPAFDVYLEHVWDGATPITGMEADFENLYWASYPNIEQFVDEFIDSLGWADARTQLLQAQGIPENILTFNREAFLEHVRSDYDFYEGKEHIHVFVK